MISRMGSMICKSGLKEGTTMQLTNYSAIDLRYGTAKVLDDRDHSIRRITTGERLARPYDDSGAVAVAAKHNVTNHQRAALRTNLQNARTYLEVQGGALQKVHDVYGRMGALATKAFDVTLTDQDREDLDIEFQELVNELDRIAGEKFNGVRLFNQNVKCGGIQDIPLGELDYRAKDKGPDGLISRDVTPRDPSLDIDNVIQTIRGQTLDVHATGGTLSFSVNSGQTGEVYRVFMGGQELFSTGPSFAGPDPTLPIINGYRTSYTGSKPFNDTSGSLQTTNWGTDCWRTSGTANNGDTDTFKITFGPGKTTSFEIDYGGSNQPESFNGGGGMQGQLVADGGVIRTSDFGVGASTTELTLQFETASIGIISNVTFEPQSEDTEVTIGENGDTMTISAKGFSTISGYDLKTAANAQVALNKLLGDENTLGEADCILYDRLSSVRAEVSRLDERITKLANDLVQGEAAHGRVADLDYAREMTRFATNTIQLNVMTTSMATVNQATDVLMPLTTQRFESAMTQRFQLI
jgi:flagellin-like hook-associated protein FlgL